MHWSRPSLNIAPEVVDDPASNLIQVGPPEDGVGQGLLDAKWYRGAHAFYDEKTTDPEKRYKLVWRQGHDIYVASSRDGLRFVTHGRVIDFFADTSPSHFFDPLRDEYVLYGRVWFDRQGRPSIQERLGGDGKPPVRRGVVLHRSPEWAEVPWPEATTKEVLIDPMDVFKDGGWTDIYTPSVQVYHGQYIGLPAVYFRRVLDDRTGTAGPIYPIFMHSLDGRNWAFPDKKHPIIELGPHLIDMGDTMEAGMVFPAASIIEVDGALRVYYVAHAYQHHGGGHGDKNNVRYNLAVMRMDGFASLSSKSGDVGVWETPALSIPEYASTLHVNADVSGELTVELLEPETDVVLNGLSAANCAPFSGDDTDAIIRWDDATIADASGREVWLKIAFAEGEVFSFWFE